MKLTKVDSIEHLKELLKDEETHDFRLMLNGGCYSAKEISYSLDGQFIITNCIDGTEQYLSEDELMNQELTNIGIAITKGAFYAELG